MLYDPKWAATEIKLEPWQLVLLKAADIIEERGWIQGGAMAQNGAVCAAGAIYDACGVTGNPAALPLYREIYARVAQELQPYANIPEWNDTTGRTQQEVTSTLRKLAKGNA